jgi:hypothetical protein
MPDNLTLGEALFEELLQLVLGDVWCHWGDSCPSWVHIDER